MALWGDRVCHGRPVCIFSMKQGKLTDNVMKTILEIGRETTAGLEAFTTEKAEDTDCQSREKL